MTTSGSAYCEVYLHKRENKLHHNTDLQKVKTEARNGSYAFARDLAKHAPLSLYCLMRVIASGDRASLQ